MLSREENELLTRTGRGTPCGELMRRYWQPAALSEELPAGGAPLPVMLFGEELVLFRNEQGQPGLLGLHCSHRGADLSYGRLEDGGLRCIYHGWLYDIHGRCLEQPGEPSNSWTYSGGQDSMQSSTLEAQTGARSRPFYEKIRHLAYPCQEVGGIIYTYMGPGEPPLLPPYEFIRVPVEYRSNAKVFQDCNYLQANEGNFDPTHLSFLHQQRTDNPETQQALNAECRSPLIEAEETDFGARIYCVRKVHGDRNYVRVTNFVLPNFAAVTGTADGHQVLWHVPIDDTHHWRYMIWFSRTTPISKDNNRYFSRSDEFTEGYRYVRNRANRYLQDRESMKSWSYCGLGTNFLPHDMCATEGAGPVQDRTREHLGAADRGIIVARQVLLRAIRDVQAGREPPALVRDPSSRWAPELVARSDALLPGSVDWHNYWRDETLTSELATVTAIG